MADYKTIKGEASSTLYEKKSEFIAHIAHVKNQAEAVECLSKIRKKYYDAGHHCYAYILKNDNIEKQSDDGEPSKTAGMPILEMLRYSELQDVILVVSRYFGGTLLGTGGLVRAYSAAARQAISAAEILEYTLCVDITVEVDYSLYDRLTVIIQNNNARAVNVDFTDKVIVTARTLSDSRKNLINDIILLTKGAEPIVGEDIFDIF